MNDARIMSYRLGVVTVERVQNGLLRLLCRKPIFKNGVYRPMRTDRTQIATTILALTSLAMILFFGAVASGWRHNNSPPQTEISTAR